MERLQGMMPCFFTAKQFGFCALLTGVLVALAGCETPWLMRGQSKDLEEVLADDGRPRVRYIGELSGVWGLNYTKVEAIALVTQLKGTGSDPLPSPQRERLISEMQSHEVRKHWDVLKSPNTSMVLVRGFLPPGIQKGERFDIEVRVPPRSKTTSLKGGFLIPTRLRPMELLGGGVRTGHIIGMAKGPLVIDSTFKGDEDTVLETRARILGGGVALKSRPLGLILRSGSNVKTAAMIGVAINSRFHATQRGIKQHVATPKNDRIIELAIPSQYKKNISRYLRVVRNIPLRETASARLERIKILERQLLDPTTAALAALRLESIGEESVETLLKGIESDDPEIRFYAAEALAYLEKTEAVEPLTQTAKEVSAFRWHALTALATMDDVEAGLALSQLLHVSSAETRYGAFRALQSRTPDDPLVKGKTLGDGFHYHAISTSGEPMVHFSRVRHPEIVVFGLDQTISPDFLFVGSGWSIKRDDEEHFKISRFSASNDDRHEVCQTRLGDLIRAMHELGGSYVEVLEVVRAAKDEGHLSSRVVIGSTPRPGRTYVREETEQAAGEEEPRNSVGSPVPELFSTHTERWDNQPKRAESVAETDEEPPESAPADGGFFGRMQNWFFK